MKKIPSEYKIESWDVKVVNVWIHMECTLRTLTCRVCTYFYIYKIKKHTNRKKKKINCKKFQRGSCYFQNFSINWNSSNLKFVEFDFIYNFKEFYWFSNIKRVRSQDKNILDAKKIEIGDNIWFARVFATMLRRSHMRKLYACLSINRIYYKVWRLKGVQLILKFHWF